MKLLYHIFLFITTNFSAVFIVFRYPDKWILFKGTCFSTILIVFCNYAVRICFITTCFTTIFIIFIVTRWSFAIATDFWPIFVVFIVTTWSLSIETRIRALFSFYLFQSIIKQARFFVEWSKITTLVYLLLQFDKKFQRVS